MRYLLVGLGGIGEKRKELLGGRCIGTVDPYNPRADYRNALECPRDGYDAVILAVPNDAKLSLLGHFLGLGKHILIEKPLLFENRRQADEFEGLAHRNNAIWYTSYNHRFEPVVATLKERLDANEIGCVYHARFFYGNGTAGNIAGTWREDGLGVVEDLTCHLLDLAAFLLNCRDTAFVSWKLDRHELRTYDHAIVASTDGRLVLESSYLCWKNTFQIELFGASGSLHLSGLRKWGPTELILRRRMHPSGIPVETREESEGADITWERDLDHFEQRCALGLGSAASDRWMSETVHTLAAGTTV